MIMMLWAIGIWTLLILILVTTFHFSRKNDHKIEEAYEKALEARRAAKEKEETDD